MAGVECKTRFTPTEQLDPDEFVAELIRLGHLIITPCHSDNHEDTLTCSPQPNSKVFDGGGDIFGSPACPSVCNGMALESRGEMPANSSLLNAWEGLEPVYGTAPGLRAALDELRADNERRRAEIAAREGNGG